jgi:3-methyladenine DNA glycosylase AlkD
LSLWNLKNELKQKANPEKAEFLQRFFKTGKAGYAEGDKFAGLVVPEQRILAKKYKDLTYDDLQKLIASKIHEERLIALFILVNRFEKGNEKEKERAYKFYIKNLSGINNWDLVDLSAPNIIGAYLFEKEKNILFGFAKSNDLWKKRISILATYYFIKFNQFAVTLEISDILLNDEHDLIHKAVGWMLREIGKRNLKIEEDFLKVRYKKMPRTMLRYAIEKFPEKKRKAYLNGKIIP